MGFIDSGSKSSRLLASRRYTHNTFTTAQESFTNVLDLRSEEILDNNIHNEIIKKRIYIQQIEYKGTGKSWVAIINEELKPLKFLKKEFLKKEKNRTFYFVECPSNYIYLINTEGTKNKDDKYFLFIDQYNEVHRFEFYNKKEVKEIFNNLN